jgi:hypothetical protein
MPYIDLTGTWINEFGSIMEITHVEARTGIFSGRYKSHTGATGEYHFTGITDPDPNPAVNSQTVAFAISWRNIAPDGDPDGGHWVSAFAGQLQLIDGQEKLTTTYLLQQETNPAENWHSTIIDKATFTRRP